MELKINEELKRHIWRLKCEEFAQLEENILAEGIRDKLIVWNGVIVDGHNRYAIAQKHGLHFEVEEKEFADIEEAKDWMDANQLGRRNLTQDQWQISIGRRYEREKKKQGTNNQYVNKESEKDKICTFQNTAYKLAEEYKIHPNSVKNYAKKAQEYVRLQQEKPELAERIESGELSFRDIKKAHVSYNSGENEWYTPQKYVESARRVMEIINLDPASSEIANKTVFAHTYYTKDDDGLLQPWRGNVWMNPPYAQPLIARFCEKLKESYEAEQVTQAIVLVNNATETRWFQDLISVASCVCFTKGRIRFIDQHGKEGDSALQGQCFLYVGKNVDKFINEFRGYGWTARIEE